MIKLLHTADLHLDSPLSTLALRDDGLRDRVENATRAAFGRIVEIALEEQVAALLVAGDLYDGSQRSVKTAAFLRSALARLGAAGVRVFIIRGNHDAESTITRDMDWPDNVHVFDGRGGHVMLTDEVAIHGVSFREPHAPDSLVPKYRPVAGATNIALLHSSLSGTAGHDPYAPCTVVDLVGAGFDYWALGHIHKRGVHSEAPFVVMPGMPQGRDMGEDGPKSATLVTLDDQGLRIEERATAALEFRRVRLDISAFSELNDVLGALQRCVRDLGGSTDVVARITLDGQTPLNWRLHRDRDLLREAAVEAAAATGSVWIDRIELATAPLQDHSTSDIANDEMAGLIAEIASAPGLLDEAMAAIDALAVDLPPELRDTWGTDETTRRDAAQHLVGEARDWATAQMHGAAVADGPEPRREA
jgi:DNA repair exonuclease SbcCD nuclease subunit